jgi:UDP-glucose 4-epimerase
LKKTILVTGACGGIGSWLVLRLLELGHAVIALDDLSSGKWTNIQDHPSLVKVTADIANIEDLERDLSEFVFSQCFHLAAISSLPECEANQIRAFDVNLLGTVNIATICMKQKGFESFVFSSTSAVYQGQEDGHLLESNLVDAPTLTYSATKFFAEHYLLALFRSHAFPVIVSRLFNVFGDLQNSTRSSPPLLNYLVREVSNNRPPVLYGGSAGKRDYISVDDVVDLLITLSAEKDAIGEVINLCNGQGLDVRQIVEIVSNALNIEISPVWKEPQDLWVNYPVLRNGPFPLKNSLVASEALKRSVGSNKKLRKLIPNFSNRDVNQQIGEMAKRISKRIETSLNDN